MTTTNRDPLLKVDGISKRFDVSAPLLNRLLEGKQRQTLTAVDQVSFDVPKGSTFAIVGESGCGKSTVARLLMGLYQTDEGEITFDGQAIGQMPAGKPPELRRRMQMIFQDPYASLNPRWRVRDIIGEPLRNFGICKTNAEVEQAVGKLLSQVGLQPADGAKFPHEFSGGQRQRLSIARALTTKPELLICDEPTSALDVSVQSQILNLMKDLQDEFGLSYVFISHDLAVVWFMAEYLAVMYLGRIVEIGPREQIFHNPQHPYTRLLMETVPKLDVGAPEHEPVAGEVPNPISPPSGCTFHPRCVFANDRCKQTAPTLATRSDGARSACHAADEGRLPYWSLQAAE
ncbi:ABC transporter ATP-binding protein [Parasedimentitalea psychrophila]|uniref:ATP-binding cassette domain-containing protein n=1 Tax=Parasedimentitalea psychrophila TaxID=2997337 RepID=A0A9Y2L1U1_9RHOB|nr:oligopeptide/dipeptide ABC transporter ATP-binding protein [Parasedimentitalea psychrophila]WIY25822.1 ATP-binding cassette domain-containing protein [Parasedimentitalea psychrophila]